METKDLKTSDLNGKLWRATKRREDGRLLIESAIGEDESVWVAEEKLEIKSDTKSLVPFLSSSIEIDGVKFTIRGTNHPTRWPAVIVKGPQSRQLGTVSEWAAHDLVRAFKVARDIMGALKEGGCATKEAFTAKKEALLACLEPHDQFSGWVRSIV